MTLNLSLPDLKEMKPRITVIGVGGAGGNAVNNMIRANLEGVEFVVANTDAQALANSNAASRIQLGVSLTEGLGAGAKPMIGEMAAAEQIEQITDTLRGSHMVFVTAGMGGGTGTGAAPVIAKAARDMGILTVGVVTKPFQFEGARRMKTAESGLDELQKWVDTLIVIPNQNLFRVANERTTFAEAFRIADEVLHSGVRGVTDLIVNPGLINLDFADVRTVMSEMGKAMMGTGEASGDNRAIDAAEAAISNPLLDDVSMKGARGVLINITGGMDLTLFEMDEAANRIRAEVDPEANIIVGSCFNPDMEGVMRVSVVATGIEAEPVKKQAAPTAVIRTLAPAKPVLVEPAPVVAFAPAAAAPQQAETLVERAMQSEPAADARAEPLVMDAPEPIDVPQAQEENAFIAPEAARPRAPRMDLSPAGAPFYDEEQPQPEKKMSLKERLFGASRKPEPARSEPARSDAPRADSGRSDSGRGAEPARSEPSLNRAPEKPRAGEDQLEIPAFLRRQAN